MSLTLLQFLPSKKLVPKVPVLEMKFGVLKK